MPIILIILLKYFVLVQAKGQNSTDYHHPHHHHHHFHHFDGHHKELFPPRQEAEKHWLPAVQDSWDTQAVVLTVLAVLTVLLAVILVTMVARLVEEMSMIAMIKILGTLTQSSSLFKQLVLHFYMIMIGIMIIFGISKMFFQDFIFSKKISESH